MSAILTIRMFIPNLCRSWITIVYTWNHYLKFWLIYKVEFFIFSHLWYFNLLFIITVFVNVNLTNFNFSDELYFKLSNWEQTYFETFQHRDNYKCHKKKAIRFIIHISHQGYVLFLWWIINENVSLRVDICKTTTWVDFIRNRMETVVLF